MPELLNRIVVAIDGSEGSTLAVEAASELAVGTDSELHLVHVCPTPPLPAVERVDQPGPMADAFTREIEEEARELLRQQAWHAEVAGATVAEKHLRVGRPAEEISTLAEEVGCGLVVVGGRRMGALKRLVSGSVSRNVARKASRPVLVVRGGWPPSHVVVGDDLSEEAGRAGELAAIIGGLYESPVGLATAYQPGNWYIEYAAHCRHVRETERRIRQELRGRAAVLGRTLEEAPHSEVAPRRPDDTLREASKGGKATLVAVGRRDLGAARRAITGGVSDGVLEAADGPVLVVPASTKGSQDRDRRPTSRYVGANEKAGGYPR